MPKLYRILDGSFRVSAEDVRGPGATIELDADIAEANKSLLEEVTEEAAVAVGDAPEASAKVQDSHDGQQPA